MLEQWRPTSIELSDKLTLLPVARWARRSGVGSVLLSHERLDDMLALRTGLDATSKVSVGLLNRLLVRSVDTVVVTSAYAQARVRSDGRRRGGLPGRTGAARGRPRHLPPAPPRPGRRCSRLVHAGRLSREKSPHLAVATAVELHRRGVPVRLDVYGVGPHRDELVELAGGRAASASAATSTPPPA